jgi:SAM-dependent methyltransferase
MQPPSAYIEAWKKPIGLIVLSLFYFLYTLLHVPFSPSLLRISKFRSKWFGLMWRRIGPQMAGIYFFSSARPNHANDCAAEPIQEPYIDQLLKTAKGTVLELGPGTGDQSHHYRPRAIDVLYGAEPNKDLHERLLNKNYELGLSHDQYRILTAGAEPRSLIPALQKAGLLKERPGVSVYPEEGVFDYIIAVKSMCSIDPAQMKDTLDMIFKLLKPGGEFLFFEHVHSNADPVTSTGIWFANLIWPSLMGNCHLNSKLDRLVNNMSEWTSKDIRVINEYEPHHPFRYVYGRCRKED